MEFSKEKRDLIRNYEKLIKRFEANNQIPTHATLVPAVLRILTKVFRIGITSTEPLVKKRATKKKQALLQSKERDDIATIMKGHERVKFPYRGIVIKSKRPRLFWTRFLAVVLVLRYDADAI